jgi:hypothetical protein
MIRLYLVVYTQHYDTAYMTLQTEGSSLPSYRTAVPAAPTPQWDRFNRCRVQRQRQRRSVRIDRAFCLPSPHPCCPLVC